MRDYGLPKLTTWRWAPCLGLVLSSVSFVGFAMLVIPDRIGSPNGTASRLPPHFARTQIGSPPTTSFSDSDASSVENVPPPAPAPPTHLATPAPDAFPKRGFTPPLERPPEPQPAAPPPPPEPPPPPPPAPDPAPPPAVEAPTAEAPAADAPEPAPAPAPE